MNFQHSALLRFVAVVFLSGCLNLKTHEARLLPPDTEANLRPFETGGPLGDAVRDTRLLAEHYQQKLAPVLTEMHRSAKIVGQEKQSRLLGQARGAMAGMAVLAAKVRISWLHYQSATAGQGAEQAMVGSIGLNLSERCLNLLDRTRRYLDLVEGYIRAGVEKNLSYLSPGNQFRFNQETDALDAAGTALFSEYDALIAALRNLRKH